MLWTVGQTFLVVFLRNFLTATLTTGDVAGQALAMTLHDGEENEGSLTYRYFC